MTHKSISWAALLPSVFAAVVIGFVLGAVVVEGPMTLFGEEPPEAYLGRRALMVAGIPWIIGYLPIWFVLMVFGLGYLEGGHLFQDSVLDCVVVCSPFINGYVLHVAGRSIDQAIERRQERTP